jgi:hypothetical protein
VIEDDVDVVYEGVDVWVEVRSRVADARALDADHSYVSLNREGSRCGWDLATAAGRAV